MISHKTALCLPRPEDLAGMATPALRESFLVGGLFKTGKVSLVMTDLDRLVVGGAVPESELRLPICEEFGTRYFTQRREVGIINIGSPGGVRVGRETFPLDRLDCLYVGIEEEEVAFLCGPAGTPAFYFLACPAHRKFPTNKLAKREAQVVSIGEEQYASKRCIHKYIHPGGIASCQLMMGLTELAPASVWNTMPAHTHSRRSEIYLYFDLGESLVVHLLGKPESTRHLIVRDRQAVLSPPWSVHSGAGTGSYRFIWGMAGENQNFEDQNPVEDNQLL